MFIQAIHVSVRNNQKSNVAVSEEMKDFFLEFWRDNEKTPFKARNHIIKSVCPQLFGLFLIKLAVLMTLIGGVNLFLLSHLLLSLSFLLFRHTIAHSNPFTYHHSPSLARSLFLSLFLTSNIELIQYLKIIFKNNSGGKISGAEDVGEWADEPRGIASHDRRRPGHG